MKNKKQPIFKSFTYSLILSGLALAGQPLKAEAALQVRLGQAGGTVIYYGAGPNIVIRTCADYSPWFTQLSECVSMGEVKLLKQDFKKRIFKKIHSLPLEFSSPFSQAELKNYQFTPSTTNDETLSANIKNDTASLKGVEGYLVDDPTNEVLRKKKAAYLNSLNFENTEKKNRELQRSLESTINSKIETMIQEQILSERISNLSYVTNTGEMFFEVLKQFGFGTHLDIPELTEFSHIWVSENGAVKIDIGEKMAYGAGNWLGAKGETEFDKVKGIMKIPAFGGGAFISIYQLEHQTLLYYWDQQSGDNAQSLAEKGINPRIIFVRE